MKRLFWLLQAGLFYLLTWLFSLLPTSMTMTVGTGIGLTLRFLLPSRRKVSEENIRASLPYLQQQPNWAGGDRSPEELTRSVFTNIGCNLLELSRLYHGRGEEIFQRVTIQGEEHHDTARSLGKGLLFLTGHFGNWELSSLYYNVHFNLPLAAVARKQNNPYLHRMVETMRMRYQNRIIYKDNAVKSMISTLKKGGTVGLLIDQAVMPNEGCVINFLGRKAWASKVPVLIAKKTGSPIIPGIIYRKADGHQVTLYPPLIFGDDQSDEAVARDVQAYCNVFEQFIIEHPESWYWIHKRWKRTEGL